MSDSNRGERHQDIGQGLAIVISITLCCLIVSVVTYAWFRQSGDSDQRADYYQAEAQRNQEAICVGRQGALLAECLEEQRRASRDAYTSEQDLNAQRNMSIWALWMFVVSTITTGLTLWALWFVRGTFKVTAEMAAKTEQATHAMLRANEITQSIADADLRPYLFVEKITVEEIDRVESKIGDEDIEGGEGEFQTKVLWIRGRIAIHFRNYGKVPARNIKLFKRSYLAEFHRGRFWNYQSNWIDLWLCAPGHERRAFGGFFISADSVENFDAGAIHFVLRLRFTYEDESGRAFTEKAAFWISGDDLKTFYLLTGPHNIKRSRESWDQYELELAQEQQED